MRHAASCLLVLCFLALPFLVTGCVDWLSLSVTLPRGAALSGVAEIGWYVQYQYYERFDPDPEGEIALLLEIIEPEAQARALGSVLVSSHKSFTWNTLRGTPDGTYRLRMTATPTRTPSAADVEEFQVTVRNGPLCSKSIDQPELKQCPQCATSSPLLAATGELYLTSVDLSMAGHRDLSRHHLSGMDWRGPFGPGWATWACMQAIEVTDGEVRSVLIRLPGSNLFRFRETAPGTYEGPESWPHLRLRRLSEGNLELRAREGSRFVFDERGLVSYLETALGERFTWEYDGDGRWSALASSRGRRYELTYGARNLLSSVEDSSGRVVTYLYDATGRLVVFTNAAGFDTNYAWDDQGRVVRVSDHLGRPLTQATFGPDGRVATLLFDGQTWTYAYEPEARRLVATDSRGRSQVTSCNELGFAVEKVDRAGGHTISQYCPGCAAGPRYRVDAAGRRTDYTYDARHNVTSVRHADGTSVTMEYGTIADQDCLLRAVDELGRVTVHEYDSRGQRILERDPLGHETRFSYTPEGWLAERVGPRGERTAYAYDPDGTVTAITDAQGTTRRMSHDARGNVISETDGSGNRTDYEVDALDRVVRVTHPADAEGRRAIETREYDHAGFLVALTDATGAVTRMDYDPWGRLVRTVDALGHEVTNTLDDEGLVVARTDPRGAVTRFGFDAVGRMVATTDALGFTRTSDLDLVGNRVAARDEEGNETRFLHDARDRLVAVVGPDGATTRFEHDDAGQRTAVVDPMGRRVESTHDAAGRVVAQRVTHEGRILEARYEFDPSGNRTAVVDVMGRRSTVTYDLLGRPVTTTDALGNDTVRVYDDAGDLVTLTNARGASWTLVYDGRHRLTTERDPLGSERHYWYDMGGRLVRMRDAKGQETTMTRDVLGRVLRVDYADGDHAVVSYDEIGNRTLVEGSGVRIEQTFDELDRLTSVTTDVLGRRVEYAYTPRGQRASMAVVAVATGNREQTVGYEWDDSGRLSRMVPWVGNAVEYSYRPDGSRAAAVLPNDIRLAYAYDDLGRLVDMTYRNASGDELAFFRYSHDDAGNPLTMRDTEGLTSYGYDGADRLTDAVYPDGTFEKFGYDSVGNRIRLETGDGVTEYDHDLGDRLLAERGARNATYEWDANGCMTGKMAAEGRTAYRWNGRNRLVGVDLPDGTAVGYSYLPLSDLRWATTGPEARRYLWDSGTANVLAELTVDGTATRSYLDGLSMDEHLAVVREGSLFAFVADPLRTVRGRVDANGQLLGPARYTAFGSVRGSWSDAVDGRFGFQGREADAEREAWYLRARSLHSNSGRLNSADEASLSRPYQFVGMRPTVYIDPTGYESVDPDGWIPADEALSLFDRQCTDTGTRWCTGRGEIPAMLRQIEGYRDLVLSHDQDDKDTLARVRTGERVDRQGSSIIAVAAFSVKTFGQGDTATYFNLPVIRPNQGTPTGSLSYCSSLLHELVHFGQWRDFVEGLPSLGLTTSLKLRLRFALDLGRDFFLLSAYPLHRTSVEDWLKSAADSNELDAMDRQRSWLEDQQKRLNRICPCP